MYDSTAYSIRMKIDELTTHIHIHNMTCKVSLKGREHMTTMNLYYLFTFLMKSSPTIVGPLLDDILAKKAPVDS